MDTILETLYIALNLFNGLTDIEILGIPLRSYYLAILTVMLVGLLFGMTIRVSGNRSFKPHMPQYPMTEERRYRHWLEAHRK